VSGLERLLSSPHGRPAALLLLVALFVAARVLLVVTTGHLLFHLDSAEYGILRGVRLYLDLSTWELLAQSQPRLQFALSTTLVADMGLHGTLVLAGLLTHFAVTALDAPLATSTLRALAIVVSTAGLLAWLRTLTRAFPRGPVPIYFGVLVLAAPPMLMKLSVLFWGTHEMVVVIHAFFMLLFLPWIVRPALSPGQAAVRAALVGVAGAVVMAANTSLVLFAALLGVWVSFAAAREARGTGRKFALLGLMAAAGVAGLGLTWWGLSSVEALAAMGLDGSLFANDKLDQVSGATSLKGPAWWAKALPKTKELWPALAASFWVLGRVAAKKSGSPEDHRLVRFCAFQVVLGLVIIMSLPFAYTGAPELRFTPRYTAALHPLGLVVVAAWLAGRAPEIRGVRLRPALILGWVAVFLPGQLAMIDLSTRDSGSRFDGTMIYYAPFHGEEVGPPASRTKLGGASYSFLIGMGLLTRYQQFDFWAWRTPAEARALDHPEMLRRHINHRRELIARPDFDLDEFYRGAGYAVRIVLGASRRAALEPTLAAFPDHAAAIVRGWETTPEDLRFRPGVPHWQGADAIDQDFVE